MSGDIHPLPAMLRAGTCAAVDLGMGFYLFVPTVKPERAAKRGLGRLGTRPTRTHKPVHGGYPSPAPVKGGLSIVRNDK